MAEMISVIIPTNNRAAYLRDAIESILAQALTGAGMFEVIVVDNDSSDETRLLWRAWFMYSRWLA